jgi:ABC-type proline/glycine betaine transport system permease subunit
MEVMVTDGTDQSGIPVCSGKSRSFFGRSDGSYQIKRVCFAFQYAALCSLRNIMCKKFKSPNIREMNVVNSLRVIPSLAIHVIAIPFLGTGFTPALVALTVLACPPVLINTFLGFRCINPAVLEAASGMGMKKWQVLTKIEFPLALPIISLMLV